MSDQLDTGNLPDDLAALARAWVPILGLDHWRITFELTDAPSDRRRTNGATWPKPRYLVARIEIKRGMETTQAQETLLHELLHVVLADVRQAAERIGELGGVDEETARRRYDDAEEPTIERLCRTLRPALLAAAGVAEPVKEES